MGFAGEAGAGSRAAAREATASWALRPLRVRPTAPATVEAAAAAVAAMRKPRRSQPLSCSCSSSAGIRRGRVSLPMRTYRRTAPATAPTSDGSPSTMPVESGRLTAEAAPITPKARTATEPVRR